MTRKVAFVLFEDAEELDFVGPWEVFTMLGQVEPGSCEAVMVSEHGGEVRCAKGMRVVADHSFETAPQADIVVIPGTRSIGRLEENAAAADIHLSAEVIAAVTDCNAASILGARHSERMLARTGL